MNNSKSTRTLATGAIIFAILLLAMNAYQWYSNTQLKTTNQRYETEMIQLEKVQAELDQAFQSSLQSLEEMRSDNKELNSLIESQKRELKAQKDKINNLIWTKRELTKAKEEIQKLNNQAANYVAEINRLKEENTLLANNNVQLQEENTVLSQQIVAEIEEKNALAAEKEEISAMTEELSKTNEKLNTKVDMANAIKINFMKVQGYEDKESGKKRKKSRAKNINMFEICFTTETNMVTPAGEKEFFVRIIDPLGETVMDDLQSGVLENKLDGTKVRYSNSGYITYNNEDTDACMEWKLPVEKNLMKGVYDIIIYNNGFPVGQGDFKLK